MLFRLACLVVCALYSNPTAAQPVPGADLALAPKGFAVMGKTAIPVDFQQVHLTLEFDPPNQKAIGTCRIDFYAREAGHPLLDLVPRVRQVALNGQSLGNSGLTLVTAPSNATQLRMVNAPVVADSLNTLEVEYELTSNEVSYSSNGIRMVWAMSDIGADRDFLEQYACANLEFDQFAMDMDLTILGNPAPHQIFTNGQLFTSWSNTWHVNFPSYFTTSSFYLHITDRPFTVKKEVWQGQQRAIPLTIYGTSASSVAQGLTTTKRVMAELENTFGPYAHRSMTAYLTSGGGGMEHVGATITSLGALGHEITHSWFARGIMPADGNSGWIDEAIASWRDNGYPRGNASLMGNTSRLSGFNEYNRITPMAAYSAGASLMSRLDGLFASGLKPVLKTVFAGAQRTTVSTPSFQKLIEAASGQSVDAYFRRYVYGGSRVSRQTLDRETFPAAQTRHPRPFTRDEIRSLR